MFEDLQDLLDKNAVEVFPRASDSPEWQALDMETATEQQLFQAAMADVTPIFREKYPRPRPALFPRPRKSHEAEALACLQQLVKNGQGFVVSDTPEYMEGRGYHVSADITRRLHRGDFSIQDHIDLHGLNVPAAKEEFEGFIKTAITQGKQAVLIVHGRGLSSPERPVLKTKVCQWLTSGYWRKWVIAFTSARPCDGGAGATYVLLRQRPMTRRYRKHDR
jgi:DNA-nicking Smr family endonuclease